MNKVAPLVALLLLLVACGGPNVVTTAPDPTKAAANALEPAALFIPTIGVNTDKLTTFGLDNKGNYECPIDPQSAAWNRDGTVPGEPGLALIVASAQGLFQRLNQLKPGDPVYINQTGGKRLTFTTLDATARTAPSTLQLAACGPNRSVAVYAALTPQ